jgi:hypothetical protein
MKPPGNTTLFVTRDGFETLNAYIESSVNKSGDHWVPIPAGGVVAGKAQDKGSGQITTSAFDSNFWEISVEVGAVVAGMKTKLVYHFGGVKRNK